MYVGCIRTAALYTHSTILGVSWRAAHHMDDWHHIATGAVRSASPVSSINELLNHLTCDRDSVISELTSPTKAGKPKISTIRGGEIELQVLISGLWWRHYIDEYQFCYFFRNIDHHSVLLKVSYAGQPLRSRLETVLKAKNLYYYWAFNRKQ